MTRNGEGRRVSMRIEEGSRRNAESYAASRRWTSWSCREAGFRCASREVWSSADYYMHPLLSRQQSQSSSAFQNDLKGRGSIKEIVVERMGSLWRIGRACSLLVPIDIQSAANHSSTLCHHAREIEALQRSHAQRSHSIKEHYNRPTTCDAVELR